MHRKGFKADPLRNEGDMKVFYCVASKGYIREFHPRKIELNFETLKTPSGIAKALRTKPPTVVEHLENLMKIGFVKRGRKKGKSQHYEVNWKKVIDKFWSLSGIHEYLVPKWGTKEIEEKTRAVLNELKNSKPIQMMIKDYFENVMARSLFELGPAKTLLFLEVPSFYDAVREFESEVAKYKFDEKEVENKKMHRLVRKWQDCLTRVHSLSGGAARDVILDAVKPRETGREEF